MKRQLCLSGLLLFLTSPAIASYFYLGPTLTYQSYYAGDSLSYQAYSPRLTAGVATWYDQWLFLAAEGFGSFKDYQYNDNRDGNLTLRTRYSFGFSALPGVYLDNVLTGYLRFGANFANFSEVDAIRRGFQSGIGLAYHCTPSWDVRAEYDFTRFNTVGSIGSPREEEYTISVLYNFNHIDW